MRGGGIVMFTPRASITSAEPHFEVMPRLPCLATRTPAPAIVSAVAVEILKVSLASPPVPQVSTRASRSCAADVERAAIGIGEWLRGGADRFGKADDLFHRLALHVHRHQQRGDLRVRGFAGGEVRPSRAGTLHGSSEVRWFAILRMASMIMGWVQS